MAAITSCPKCEKHVAVPDGLSSEAEVRCPLCDEEFQLSATLTEVPPLVVLSEPAGESESDNEPISVGDSEGLEDAFEGTLAFESLDDETSDDDESKTDGGEIDEDVDLDFTESNEDEGSTSLLGISGLESDDAGSADLDLSLDPDENADASSSGIDFASFGSDDGTEGAEADDGGELTLAPVPSFGDESSSTGEKTTAPEPKKRKGPSLVGQIIGFVLFGVAGICLGYVVLLWWKPDRLATFHRSMPFLDHVASAIGPKDAVELIRSGPPVDELADEDDPNALPKLGSDYDSEPEDQADGGGDTETYSSDSRPESDFDTAPANSFHSVFPSLPESNYSLVDLEKARKKGRNRVKQLVQVRKKGKQAVAQASGDEKKEVIEQFKEKIGELRDDVFSAYCELADPATYYLADLPEETDEELAKVAKEIGVVASSSSRRLALQKRGYKKLYRTDDSYDNNGLLFIGKVVGQRDKIGRVDIEVQVPGRKSDEPQTLRVLAPKGTEVQPNETVAVLGTIVEESDGVLDNYPFGGKPVVLSRVVVPVE